jgi:hypothetical protein
MSRSRTASPSRAVAALISDSLRIDLLSAQRWSSCYGAAVAVHDRLGFQPLDGPPKRLRVKFPFQQLPPPAQAQQQCQHSASQ